MNFIEQLLNYLESLFTHPPMPTPQPIPSTPTPTPIHTDPTITDAFILAIIKTESASKHFPNGNDNAHGDIGLKDQAYGCMQIRQPVCDDVNHHYGLHLTAQEMLGNRPLSVDTFTKYQSIYNKNANEEHMARTWNGGPGWRLHPQATDGYWKKVQGYMIE